MFPRVMDGAFPARTLQTAGFLPYWQMNRLPARPAALQRALERLLLASAGTAQGSLMRQMRADPAGMFAPISQFLFLPTSPPLRAALFRVLADLPGVQLLGHQRDRLGRMGIAVAVTQAAASRSRPEPDETLMLPTTPIARLTWPRCATTRPGAVDRDRDARARTLASGHSALLLSAGFTGLRGTHGSPSCRDLARQRRAGPGRGAADHRSAGVDRGPVGERDRPRV